MTEMIFRFDQQNVADCQRRFRGQDQTEYYSGDYSIDAADPVDTKADKRSIGACSIIRLVSRSRLRFRRTWKHIREDGIDLTVLWFVQRGSITVSGSGTDRRTALAGDFLLTRSTNPFFMECEADEGLHEVMHVTVPTHVIRRFIPDTGRNGQVVVASADSRIALARQIFTDLFIDEEPLSPDTDRRLLEAAFSLLGDAIGDGAERTPKKQTISEIRIEGVLRFIDLHLCNPNLDTRMVCRMCNISPRYLTTLLQMHGTSFTELVWGQRMEKAKEWLSASAADEMPVSEIAHRLGFKSPAHFSRRFKQVFHVNPSQCRAQ